MRVPTPAAAPAVVARFEVVRDEPAHVFSMAEPFLCRSCRSFGCCRADDECSCSGFDREKDLLRAAAGGVVCLPDPGRELLVELVRRCQDEAMEGELLR